MFPAVAIYILEMYGFNCRGNKPEVAGGEPTGEASQRIQAHSSFVAIRQSKEILTSVGHKNRLKQPVSDLR